MSKNKEKVDRRKFLKMSIVGAAGGVAVIASKSVSADKKVLVIRLVTGKLN